MDATTNRLDQSTVWVSGAGRAHRIDRMPREHAANAAAWLETHAVRLLMLRETLTQTTVTADRIAQILADPVAEMRDTALHKALKARSTPPPTRRKPR